MLGRRDAPTRAINHFFRIRVFHNFLCGASHGEDWIALRRAASVSMENSKCWSFLSSRVGASLSLVIVAAIIRAPFWRRNRALHESSARRQRRLKMFVDLFHHPSTQSLFPPLHG